MPENSRFGRLWSAWDERIQAGEKPASILADAKDEDLVEILGGESSADRKYARDIIATELLNRLHSRSTMQGTTGRAVTDSARAAHDAAKDGQEAIHRAEGILKASGEWDLGASLSASAYASLDATKAASKAAHAHAESIQGTQTQSRVGTELADEAARKAGRGHAKAREVEGRMEDLGRGPEGRAAIHASKAIKTAADHAADEAESGNEAESRDGEARGRERRSET